MVTTSMCLPAFLRAPCFVAPTTTVYMAGNGNDIGNDNAYINPKAKNVLIEVSPQPRIPRVYSHFCSLVV